MAQLGKRWALNPDVKSQKTLPRSNNSKDSAREKGRGQRNSLAELKGRAQGDGAAGWHKTAKERIRKIPRFTAGAGSSEWENTGGGGGVSGWRPFYESDNNSLLHATTKEMKARDFPGGPVAKTPPWWGLRSHMSHGHKKRESEIKATHPLQGIPGPLWANLSFSYLSLATKPLTSSVQFSSVAQSCPTLCDPMSCSTPGLPVHH